MAKYARRGNSLVGLFNEHGLEVVSGPYKKHGKHQNMTAWEMKCPFCKGTFITSTNRGIKAKSCYDCRYSIRKSYTEESTWKHLYAALKGRRNSHRYGCSLTFEEFKELSEMPCEYCGFEGFIVKGHRDWSAEVKANGLDRVDSKTGYHIGNVVPCCRRCNVGKSYMSRKEFLAWVQRVAKHNDL